MKNLYKKGNMGPLIASIVVILVLIVSGVYALKNRPLKPDIEVPSEADIQALESQNTSTEISDIEADLNASNLEGLGSDIDTAGAELQ